MDDLIIVHYNCSLWKEKVPRWGFIELHVKPTQSPYWHWAHGNYPSDHGYYNSVSRGAHGNYPSDRGYYNSVSKGAHGNYPSDRGYYNSVSKGAHGNYPSDRGYYNSVSKGAHGNYPSDHGYYKSAGLAQTGRQVANGDEGRDLATKIMKWRYFWRQEDGWYFQCQY